MDYEFKEGKQYANRKGRYTVVELNEPKMTVEYEDGTTAELNIVIQHRIWENIVAEEELRSAKSRRSANRKKSSGTQFFVRPANALKAEELGDKGWKEHVTVEQAPGVKIAQGDRLIYFSVENQAFFAVATVTGAPVEPSRRDRPPDSHAEDPVLLFTMDIDAQAMNMENAVTLDSVEFESQTNIKKRLNDVDDYVPISEDEFELLAELLTEASEEEDDDELVDDDEEFDD
ncbi:MAG: hypothetical protein PVH18_01150 [Chloroflexota bacterium]|jgi:hypothetical protein